LSTANVSWSFWKATSPARWTRPPAAVFILAVRYGRKSANKKNLNFARCARVVSSPVTWWNQIPG